MTLMSGGKLEEVVVEAARGDLQLLDGRLLNPCYKEYYSRASLGHMKCTIEVEREDDNKNRRPRCCKAAVTEMVAHSLETEHTS